MLQPHKYHDFLIVCVVYVLRFSDVLKTLYIISHLFCFLSSFALKKLLSLDVELLIWIMSCSSEMIH